MLQRLFLCTVMLFLTNISKAQAYFIDAILTADNHYGLYFGNANASNLTFVGRNEFGPWGSTGGYNWSRPESYSFDVGLNDYLYVLAWDDRSVTQSWIGEFKSSNFATIFSNTADWQFMVATGANPGDYGNVPLLATVQNDIATATWATPLASTPNGSSPWGTIPGISSSADFIWHDTFANNSTSDQHYAIYRTQLPQSTVPGAAAVPEPMTMCLLGFGLAGSFIISKRKEHRLK